MRDHLRLIAVLLPLMLIARYALFEDADEFSRFYGALRKYVLPVLFANIALIAVILLVATRKRVNRKRHSQIANFCFWGSSAILAATLAYAFAAVKLSAAP